MARPRTSSDEWLLVCAEQALLADGPAHWTLAGAASRAGASAATYVNRFGSKDEVVRALSRRWIASIAPAVAAATEGLPPGPRQVLAATLCGFTELDDSDRAGAQLAVLAADLVDPLLRGLLAQGWSAVQNELAALVSSAHHAGHLTGSPPSHQAARILSALANGASLDWSLRPIGRMVDRIAEDVKPLLGSWNAEGKEDS